MHLHNLNIFAYKKDMFMYEIGDFQIYESMFENFFVIVGHESILRIEF